MSKVFKRGRGFTQAAKEEKAIKERREQASSSLWRFFLKDGEEDVPLIFLTEEPVLFYEHSVKQPNGKFDNVVCTGEDCPHCVDGNPSYKGAWLVIDGREFTYKKDGKEVVGKDQIRIYARGMQDVGKLARKSKRYGLTGRQYLVSKTGSGTATSYELEPEDELELSPKELANIFARLPQKYREHIDPSDEETYYEVLEDSLFGDVINPSSDADDDDDEDDDEDLDSGVRPSSSRLKGKLGAKKPLKKKRALKKK